MNYEVRQDIEHLISLGYSKRQISEKTGYSLSAIYYEIECGTVEHTYKSDGITVQRYSAAHSQKLYDLKRRNRGRPLKLGKHHDFAQKIEYLIIKEKCSPYAALQIVKQHGGFCVSVTTLYRYINAGYFYKLRNVHLPAKMKRRQKTPQKRGTRPQYGVSIESRPDEVRNRANFGHWEIDTVIGSIDCIKTMLVATERSTRLQAIELMPDKTTASVARALKRIRGRYKGMCKTLTCDNGPEFSGVKAIEKIAPLYFCHPYSAWERGSNENANLLIRRWWPKGKSMKTLTRKDCQRIEDWMNNYPRKIFDGKSSYEMAYEKLFSKNY